MEGVDTLNLKGMLSLHNKNILITGGNSYLGKAMCEALAEFGATLLIGSRNVKRNEELCNYLREKYNNINSSYFLDISDKKSIKTCIDCIIKDYKKIDVLINNSFYGAGREFEKINDKDWYLGIDGTINSVYRCTQEVLKYMSNNNSGKIINIASMYGVVAPDISIYEGNNFYNPCNYGVGKAGIIQFTKYIAAVYGCKGITCNAISPGPFPNPEVQREVDFIKKLENKVPMKRVGKPYDLKGIILLLCSDASNYINGANIPVDGGWTIW